VLVVTHSPTITPADLGQDRKANLVKTRLPATTRFGHAQWHLLSPIDLSDIEIQFDHSAPPPTFDGSEDLTSDVRPLRLSGGKYPRYSYAIRDVAKPRPFDNRLSWRLVDAKFADSRGQLSFGYMNYLEAMDTCEAIAHETAAALLIGDTQISPPSWTRLRFRKAIGDPFDLLRRPVVMSINTLTLRRDKTSVSVVLHNRNAANVATSGGIIGVMPAGVFQPSSVRPGDYTADFDLWRNIMREYSEEFLGLPEHDGDGSGADYGQEPLRSLNLAREAGAVRLSCFGLGIGALDLWCRLETVAVFDADVFDEIFSGLVRVNNEGSVMRVGTAHPTVHIPFTRSHPRTLGHGAPCARNRLQPRRSLEASRHAVGLSAPRR
jgi:hypothetical protein